jgi:hypothetical protein
MRGTSLLRGLVVCAAAAGPLSVLCGDGSLHAAWMDAGSSYWIRYYRDSVDWHAVEPIVRVAGAISIARAADFFSVLGAVLCLGAASLLHSCSRGESRQRFAGDGRTGHRADRLSRSQPARRRSS